MDFYETYLEVVEGVFTLSEILHTDILEVIPERFPFNVPLNVFYTSASYRSFKSFVSEDKKVGIYIYNDRNLSSGGFRVWGSFRVFNTETNETFSCNIIDEVLAITIYHRITNDNNVDIDTIKEEYSIEVSPYSSTIPGNFLKKIRVKTDAGIYDIDGNKVKKDETALDSQSIKMKSVFLRDTTEYEFPVPDDVYLMNAEDKKHGTRGMHGYWFVKDMVLHYYDIKGREIIVYANSIHMPYTNIYFK